MLFDVVWTIAVVGRESFLVDEGVMVPVVVIISGNGDPGLSLEVSVTSLIRVAAVSDFVILDDGNNAPDVESLGCVVFGE